MKISRVSSAMMWRPVLFCLLLISVAGCAVSNAGKTVGKGTVQLEGSIGGPLFKNLGPTIPIPNVPIGVRYGFTSRIDGQAHINILPIIMGGFALVDVGVTMAAFQQREGAVLNLAFSLSGAIMTDMRSAVRGTPIPGVTISRQFGRVIPFVGFESYVDSGRPRLIGNLHGGVEFEWKQVSLQASAMWLDPGFDASESTLKYVSPNNSGAIGVLLGVKIRPQAWQRGTK